MRSLLLALVLTLLWANPAHADVVFAPVFGDRMVLQRDRAVPVWGRARPGAAITVTLGERSAVGRADAHGHWRVDLEPLAAGGPHALEATGDGTTRCADVLIGEVWICSGQSNMQWTVAASGNAQEEIAAADHPRLRLLSVPRRPSDEPAETLQAAWEACTPSTVRNFSAVAYYFGRRMLEALDVPVGLVNTSYGGTPAEAWTARSALERERALHPLLDRWDETVRRGARRGAKQDLRLSPHRPATLWNGMVAPLVPFAMRGVIWYQGESNAARADQYRTLFPTLIRDWRAQWRQGDFPFLFVQLANFKARAPLPGESAWAELREAQRLTLAALPGTGMAVTIDIGEAGNIHPKNKQDVGARLAAWALAHTHGLDVVPSGPLFQGAKRYGNGLALTFAHAEGLAGRAGEALRGFAVAGRDKRWCWGEARVLPDGRVAVTHPEGRRVRWVRYAWADNPDGNLVNGAGLPASPFRTDDLPWTTAGKD